jgi:hypothetical protein
VSGQATYTTSTLSVTAPGSPHTVQAKYNGDNAFDPSNGSLSGGQGVNQAATTTAVTQAPSPAVFGQPFTLTATVTPNAPATGAPTGSVQFKNGSTNLGGPVTLDGSGKAPLSVSSLPPGTTITAVYTGDTNFVGSSGSIQPAITAGRVLTGSYAGNVTLSGGTWILNGANVSGALTVARGTSVAIIGSTVGGSMTATTPGTITVCGSTIRSNLSVSGATGFVLVGDPGDDGCAVNHVLGSLSLTGSRAGVEATGNRVSQSMTFSNNRGGGPFATDASPEIEGNVIASKLSCSGNSPTPTDNGNRNTANTKSGQCASL